MDRDMVSRFGDVGCEFYDIDCGDNGSEAISRARKILGVDT